MIREFFIPSDLGREINLDRLKSQDVLFCFRVTMLPKLLTVAKRAPQYTQFLRTGTRVTVAGLVKLYEIMEMYMDFYDEDK